MLEQPNNIVDQLPSVWIIEGGVPAQSGLMLSGASGAMGCMHVRRVGLSSVSLRLGMSMGLRLGVGFRERAGGVSTFSIFEGGSNV